jgi:hypothetical protein
MAVTADRQGHVPGGTSGQSTSDQLRRSPSSGQQTRKSWVAPAWERLDTPMEITMYAGQR